MILGVVGLGLIGGSFAKAYVKSGWQVLACDVDTAMLEFAKPCKQRGAKVVLSVVDVLSPKEVDECKKIASKMGVEFRLREKE